MSQDNDRKYWLDDARNVDRLVYGLYGMCALLFIADAFYHKHVYFSFEHWFGFYGVFGFVACVVLVLVAKSMRRVVMRDEDYYGDDTMPGERDDD